MAAPNLRHRSLLLLLLSSASFACRTLALTVMSDYEDGFATFYGAVVNKYIMVHSLDNLVRTCMVHNCTCAPATVPALSLHGVRSSSAACVASNPQYDFGSHMHVFMQILHCPQAASPTA